MKYLVNISDEAKERIRKQVHYIAVEKLEPKNAADWLADVDAAINSLDFLPERCALAPENSFSTTTIHMLPVKNHLVLFTINKDSQTVDVLSFRAGWQRPIKDLTKRRS